MVLSYSKDLYIFTNKMFSLTAYRLYPVKYRKVRFEINIFQILFNRVNPVKHTLYLFNQGLTPFTLIETRKIRSGEASFADSFSGEFPHIIPVALNDINLITGNRTGRYDCCGWIYSDYK